MSRSLISGIDAKGNPREVNISHNEQTGNDALLVDIDTIDETFTAVYTASQTAVSIIIPPTGKSLSVKEIAITTDATTGDIELDFLTSGKPIARLYAAVQNRVIVKTGNIKGATNDPVTLTTTTGAKNVFILINYIERN